MSAARRSLKVYGWTAHIRPAERDRLGLPDHIRQARCFVAATSMAEVGRLVGRSPRALFNLSETGNDRECAIALGHPRQFFLMPLNGNWATAKVIEVLPTVVM